MSEQVVYEIICPDGKSRGDLYKHEDKANADALRSDCGRADDEDDPCPTGAHTVAGRRISGIRNVDCSMCGGSCMYQMYPRIQDVRGLIDASVSGGYAQSFPQDGESWRFSLCEWCLGAIVMVCAGKVEKSDYMHGEDNFQPYGAQAILLGTPPWRYPDYTGEANRVRKAILQLSLRCDDFLAKLSAIEMARENSKSNTVAALLYNKYRNEGWYVDVKDNSNSVTVVVDGKYPDDAPTDVDGVVVLYLDKKNIS